MDRTFCEYRCVSIAFGRRTIDGMEVVLAHEFRLGQEFKQVLGQFRLGLIGAGRDHPQIGINR